MVSIFGPGPAMDGIQAQRTHYNEFVESGSKSWALMGRQLVWEWAMIKQKLRTQNQTTLRSREKGLLVRGCEFPAPLASQEPFFPSPPPFSSERSLILYISFSLVHPPPTLVSHPCLYLSARPIGYSFQCSASYCGPHRTVQGSRLHKQGQSVSYRYLIRM